MSIDYRQAIKDEQFPAGAKAAMTSSILAAVMDIWQIERGHMIEDQEAYDGLQETASELLMKHDADAKDASELVDKILADMPGSATYRDPAISGRLLS